MSGQSGLKSEPTEEVTPATAEQTAGGTKTCDRKTSEEEEGEEEEEEEEEMCRSAHLEPSTLPWPGDKDKKPQTDKDDEVRSEKAASEPGETENQDPSEGQNQVLSEVLSQDPSEDQNQDLSEDQNQAESDRKDKGRWRESLPEGERWRDEEVELRPDDKGDGSLADDEDEEEEEEGGDRGGESHWFPEKTAPCFTPQVTIVRPSSKEETELFIEEEKEPQTKPEAAEQFHHDWTDQDDKYYLCEPVCCEKLKLAAALAAAGLIFPLLTWGGYVLLPFESPRLDSTPLRVVYTLRCSFFAIVPVLLGVLVQGAARLRHSSLRPLYHSKPVHREVAVHWHFINESLALFLFYFLQLAVMATYISQDLLKLVPLLTIVFVFGRLIYWLCLSLGSSSVRSFGFGLSFFPILVMLGANVFFICWSVGQEAVFDTEPPTTAPPPKQRWWG